MALHNRILLGLVAGAALGVTVNLASGGGATVDGFVRNVTEPAGKMWLAALIMVVIPLIVSTLSLGIAGLGSLRRLGRSASSRSCPSSP
jgi:DAACS family dicarboxylate/amino acid:cation (Na+ or H+) symporter